ncbi:hypothetical protein [Nonomuraea fuscirosea]|uniref:hypothetical protein n=1 Tax=Nonomuraea fuscirosea TaxID=1291556 RepID=UPI0033FCC4C1
MNDIQGTADRLMNAYATKVSIDRSQSPIRGWRWTTPAPSNSHRSSGGRAQERRLRGTRPGLTSAAIQARLGVHRPDYGHLTASMFHLDGDPIDVGRFLQPRIEPEIVLVLGKPLAGPGLTTADTVECGGLPAARPGDHQLADPRLEDQIC